MQAGDLSATTLNLTVTMTTALQIFYCLDYLLFEASTLTSFKVMYEGTGYMVCIGNLLYPSLMTLGSRYLFYQKVHRTNGILAALAACFITGYLIYRWSNLQKDQFRKNPYSNGFANTDTILTPRGTKLIVSGFWGQLRHPNYFGEIIMMWSLACIELNNDILMQWSAICCTLLLIHRAQRDDSRCRIRYGSAWEQYCLRVKSMIFKRVY